MESGIESNLAQWSEAMQKRISQLGLDAKTELEKQAGFLARELIDVSGPRSFSTASASIAKGVGTAFGQDGRDGFIVRGGKYGRGDVDWYSWDSENIRGIARDMDVRDKSEDELYALYKTLQGNQTRKGMLVVGRRGKQTVKIWQKFVVKKTVLKGLIKRIVGHLGRRQAGWLPAWRALGSPEGGGNPIPQRVLKHEAGARGYYLDELQTEDHPAFTLINNAVGSSKLADKVNRALKNRVAKMMVDLRLRIQGVKS